MQARLVLLAVSSLFLASNETLAAGRTVISTSIRVISDQYNKDPAGGNAEGSSATLFIALSNLSNRTQNVHVTLEDQNVANSFCLAASPPTPSGGWHSTSGNCYNNSQSISSLTQDVTMNAGQSLEVGFNMHCNWPTTGPHCTLTAAAPAFVNYGWNLGGTSVSYVFRVRIHIDEDPGAILSSVAGQAFLWLGYTQQSPYFNQPLNGGRAF